MFDKQAAELLGLVTVLILFNEVGYRLRVLVIQNFLDCDNISESVNNLVADFENESLLPSITEILSHVSNTLTVDVLCNSD